MGVSPIQNKSENSRAIVTDGLWRKSLSAIRSLGKAGFDVHVMGDSVFTTGFWSSFTRSRNLSLPASKSPSQFGENLLKLLTRYPGSVVLPMEDPSLAWVVENISKVSELGFALMPPQESAAIAQDKAQTLRLAKKLGLNCPQTWEPESAEDFAKLVTPLKTGEFVVKPRSGTGSSGIVYQANPSADYWLAHWEKFGAMLVQERVPATGKGQGISLLMDQAGKCVAHFGHERIQQYPNSGGPSTDRHGIVAPELLEQSLALIKSLNWRGIAMVEWKVDPRNGQSKLMEINPRFWGSLELAVRSGVDFPTLYARAARGESLPSAPAYREGLRCRWVIPGDILRFLTQPKKERESIWSFLRGLPKSAEEWDPRDLRGAVSTLICTFALAINPRYWKYLRRG